MTSRAERLLDWPVPERRHAYDRRDTAFYALSVGFGAGAPDRRLLPFVDPWREDLRALPSMALVLGYPGFWLGEPEVAAKAGVTIPQILHVDQAVVLHRPLPAAATVVGATRVTGLVDRGPERGTFLYSERLITDAANGDLLATCRQTHLLRGVSGSGSSCEPPPRAASPTGAADAVITVPTRPEQALLYRLNGDANPLHIDPQVSSRAGFEAPILHGMCTIGAAVGGLVRALTDYQPERIVGFSVRLSAPTLPGDALMVEIWPGGAFRARAAGRDVTVLDGGQVSLR